MHTHTTRSLAPLVAAALAASLAGCGDGGSSPTATAQTGRLSIGLTDGPVDQASEVVVKFTGIELQRANGELVQIDFAQPRQIDLLKLRDGVTTDLTNGAEVPAGEYQWLRLKVSATQNVPDSYIMLPTGQFPLWIPSGMETGLKLVRPFRVAQGGETRLLVDFDLRKSVTAPPGQAPNYLLRPALRLMDRLQIGRITATVDLTRLAGALGTTVGACRPAVYLYAGAVTAPDDMDGSDANGADPIVYAPVANDGVNQQPTLTIPFVATGDYRLAATCNFDVDRADRDDYTPPATPPDPNAPAPAMKWTALVPVTVAANATATATLPAP